MVLEATTETTTAEDTALAAASNAAVDASADQTGDDVAKDESGKDADTTSEAKEADAGGKDEAATGAPEVYDTSAFKMPEGVEFDAEGFGAVEPVLRELNLTQDQAGKLMAAYGEKIVPLIQKRTADQFDNQAAELRADLARELQADPEVGGKKLDESRSFAAKAIAHFIPKADERNEFATFLNESGLGNNRFLMRLVAGAGRTLSEASTLSSANQGKPVTESEKFYGRGGN